MISEQTDRPMYAGFLMVEISSFITCKISIWLRNSPDHKQVKQSFQVSAESFECMYVKMMQKPK